MEQISQGVHKDFVLKSVLHKCVVSVFNPNTHCQTVISVELYISVLVRKQ